MNVLTLVVEKAGSAGITPTQIYDQMNVGVQYSSIARVVALLYDCGFITRCRSLTDTRVFNYRPTKSGHEIYLKHSFDAGLIQREAACIKKLGWEEVNLAVFEQTRTHFDLPCFCDEPCHFLNKTGQCTYGWPELEADKK